MHVDCQLHRQILVYQRLLISTFYRFKFQSLESKPKSLWLKRYDQIKIWTSSFTPRSSISTVEASIDTVCPALTAASGTSLSSYKFVKNNEFINVDFPRPLNRMLTKSMNWWQDYWRDKLVTIWIIVYVIKISSLICLSVRGCSTWPGPSGGEIFIGWNFKNFKKRVLTFHQLPSWWIRILFWRIFDELDLANWQNRQSRQSFPVHHP